VSPTASLTLALSDGGAGSDGVVVDPLHAAAVTTIDPTMIASPFRVVISSAFRKKPLTISRRAPPVDP